MSATSETLAKQEGCAEAFAHECLVACGHDPVKARQMIRAKQGANLAQAIGSCRTLDEVQELLQTLGGNYEMAATIAEHARQLNADPIQLARIVMQSGIPPKSVTMASYGARQGLVPVVARDGHALGPRIDRTRAKAVLDAAEAEFGKPST